MKSGFFTLAALNPFLRAFSFGLFFRDVPVKAGFAFPATKRLVASQCLQPIEQPRLRPANFGFTATRTSGNCLFVVQEDLISGIEERLTSCPVRASAEVLLRTKRRPDCERTKFGRRRCRSDGLFYEIQQITKGGEWSRYGHRSRQSGRACD